MLETQTLEYRILSLLRSREAYLKYSNIVKEELFESRETKYIHKLLLYYHKHAKGKALAPLSSLFALVSSRVKSNEAGKYIQVIKKVKKYPLTDEAIADSIVKRFVQRQLLKIVVLDAVHSLDREEHIDIAKLRGKLDEALLVDSTDLLDTAYDYFSNPSQRLQQDKEEERIATLLSPSVDHAMRRGLAGGEIAIVVAPTSVGKTMFLINIAYNAMKQGKKVVFVTLELSGKKIAGRFDQRVTGKSIEFIEKHPEIVYRDSKRLAKLGGGLRIKDCTANKLSANELTVYLERLRKNFEFDMVVVDQADLMYSLKEYKERRYELSSIIIALRRMGATFNIPVWTASQATRAAGAAGATTVWDIAEDIGKANWADIIVTLSQSDEDKDEKVMFLQVAKNRIGEGNPRVVLQVDYATMRIQGQQIKEKD
jgi:replicative DNA helicase